jgi:hypothetical protein
MAKRITEAKREVWLARLTDRLRPHFAAVDYTIPDNVRVSCGWPSRGGDAPRRRVGGQCWHPDCSSDNTIEIFISPTIDDRMDVAHILAHELIHATVGNEAGHGPIFRACATAIGLEGPMRSTEPSEAFKRALQPILQRMGDYAHASLNSKKSGGTKKQTTRLKKVTCRSCGYVARVTQTWIDLSGPPICPTCCPTPQHQMTEA